MHYFFFISWERWFFVFHIEFWWCFAFHHFWWFIILFNQHIIGFGGLLYPNHFLRCVIVIGLHLSCLIFCLFYPVSAKSPLFQLLGILVIELWRFESIQWHFLIIIKTLFHVINFQSLINNFYFNLFVWGLVATFQNIKIRNRASWSSFFGILRLFSILNGWFGLGLRLWPFLGLDFGFVLGFRFLFIFRLFSFILWFGSWFFLILGFRFSFLFGLPPLPFFLNLVVILLDFNFFLFL